MFGGKDFKAVWGKNGRRQETESEHTHTHPETSGMQSGLGKNSPSPPPTRPENLPFQGKALTGWHPGNPVPGCQRGYPHPRHTSFSPPPAPADAAVHTLDLLLFPLLSPSSLGRACSLAAWQEPAVSLWVPTSPLISTQSPCARVRPLRGLMPVKATNLSPCIPQHGWPGRPITPALQWTAPRQGGRSELAQQACRRMQGLSGVV